MQDPFPRPAHHPQTDVPVDEPAGLPVEPDEGEIPNALPERPDQQCVVEPPQWPPQIVIEPV